MLVILILVEAKRALVDALTILKEGRRFAGCTLECVLATACKTSLVTRQASGSRGIEMSRTRR